MREGGFEPPKRVATDLKSVPFDQRQGEGHRQRQLEGQGQGRGQGRGRGITFDRSGIRAL
jgi:hypothetical protein